MPQWSEEQLKSTLVGKKMYENNSARLHAAESKHAEGVPLVRGIPAEEHGLPGVAFNNVHRYRIHFAVWSMRPCDWDNFRCKYLQDGLVKLGLLPSDDWQVLEGSISSHKADCKEEERTEITITRLP